MSSSTISFAFIGEGPSDRSVVVVLRELVRRAGADEVTGVPFPCSGTSRQKVDSLLAEMVTPYDLVFLHRDADTEDSGPRLAEVNSAFAEARVAGVPVVPVQETEAWLLTDEQAIRDVVGRPSGKTPLGLPKLQRIEAAKQPKEILARACVAASESSGKRLRRVRRDFGLHRSTLLERLDPDGPVSSLPSFQRLVKDTTTAVQACLGGRAHSGENGAIFRT